MDDSKLASLGRSTELPANLRTRAERALGEDFGGVRLMSGPGVSRFLGSIRAAAATRGDTICIDEERLGGSGPARERILAHELGHVAQQRRYPEITWLQRAEVDDRPHHCASLVDVGPKIDAKVRAELDAARGKLNTKASPEKQGRDMTKSTYEALGKTMTGTTPIEAWMEKTFKDSVEIYTPNIVDSKFSDTFYAASPLSVTKGVVKVGRDCVGIDKIGHFFDNGYAEYKVEREKGATHADLEGVRQEREAWGLGMTGVFSNADLQANLQGRSFYKGLEINRKIEFSAAKEVDASWNETMNPSFYAKSMPGQADFAARIWRTIMLDASWTGEYVSAHTGKGYFAMLKFNDFQIKSNTSMWAEGMLTLQATSGSMIDLDVAGETTLKPAGKARGVQVTDAVDGVDMKLISDKNGPLGETQIHATSIRETALEGTWRGGADGSGRFQGTLELSRF